MLRVLRANTYEGQYMEQAKGPDPLRKLQWRGIRGRTALKATCAQCGETQNVEMGFFFRAAV